MKELITIMKIVKYIMLGIITVSVVYIALWFEHYERYIT
jgi:hypothetical protein